MTALQIAPFTEQDWTDFWPVFTAVAAAGDTYALDADMPEDEARAFWCGQPGAVVTARLDGQLLGSAKMGPNRPAQGSHVGTASFMVGEQARGRGVGRALGEYVVGWHRDHGFRAIQFNAVVSTNTAAIRLWQSLGFAIVGTVPDAFRLPSGDHADLHVMHLELA